MANLDSILKSRDITLPTKVHIVKAIVFPIVIYGCESWIIRKAEHRKIDAFELWCWRRLLRVPWTTRRSNQSILKETSPEYSLEGLMLKLQYFDYLMQRTDSLGKTQMPGSGTLLQYSCLENPMDGGAWQAAVHGVTKSRTRVSDFTFTLHFNALEKEMATHSSVLAWRIPGMGEPGWLLSMGLHRVEHD